VVAIANDKCFLLGGACDIKQTKVYPYMFEAGTDKTIVRRANMN